MGIRPHPGSYFVQRVAVNQKSQPLKVSECLCGSPSQIFIPTQQAQGNEERFRKSVRPRLGMEQSLLNITGPLHSGTQSSRSSTRRSCQATLHHGEQGGWVMSPLHLAEEVTTMTSKGWGVHFLKLYDPYDPDSSIMFLQMTPHTGVYGQHKSFCALWN